MNNPSTREVTRQQVVTKFGTITVENFPLNSPVFSSLYQLLADIYVKDSTVQPQRIGGDNEHQ